MNILDLIPEGEANAVSMTDLANLAGYDNTRALRRHIEQLRISGEIICSSSAGYFRHANEYELREYYNRHHNRAATALVSLRPVEKILGVSC